MPEHIIVNMPEHIIPSQDTMIVNFTTSRVIIKPYNWKLIPIPNSQVNGYTLSLINNK